jgi:hypothetical protein
MMGSGDGGKPEIVQGVSFAAGWGLGIANRDQGRKHAEAIPRPNAN